MRVRAFAAALAMAGGLAVGILPATAAHAECDGTTGYVGQLIVAGEVWASETPRPTTCNENNTYTTDVRSHKPGWRARLLWMNSGLWSSSTGPFSLSSFQVAFTDTNHNSALALCVDDGDTYYCGWRTLVTVSDRVTYTYSGITNGF